MKAFYILKPDMIERKEVLKEYLDIVNNLNFISNRQYFLIPSWIEIASRLYDPIEKDLSLKEKLIIRKQMLTTLKGYDYLYKDKPAIVDIFEVEDINCLKRLEEIKYQIRKKYVLNTPKNYFKFNNFKEEELKKELKNISIRNIDVIHIRKEFNEELSILGFNLAYLNCIHFPDPNISCIENDINILETSKVLKKIIYKEEI